MTLNRTPVEVVVAALSTESSTMDELECSFDIRVSAFIRCTTRNTFDVHVHYGKLTVGIVLTEVTSQRS